jgi:5-methylcytosine-specific restriction endonuclease McrA
MPKCSVKGCKNFTQYKNTKQIYCVLHLGRVRRHGYPDLKRDAYQSLEKLPHQFVDNFIRKNCETIIDEEIAKTLKRQGYKGATTWTVRYRRRKLGIKKYLYGEIQKHKAWIRTQAIKKYGSKCELCGYSLAIDTHHIIPKQRGGLHKTDNLIVICPNCHALITRKQIILKKRADIPKIRRRILKSLRVFYPNLG